MINENNNIENGQNTEKSPGDLRRLAITQYPVKDHQFTLTLKTLMSNNDNDIENRQNTEKSPGDVSRLAATQTPVKNHRLTQM